MRLVRWLFGLAVLATALWCGWWFVGVRALELGIDQILDDPASPIAAEDRSVRGFPNRFDITLTRPRLVLPALAWSAPFVQVFALSYRPHHVIVVFPPEQRLDLPGAEWLLRTADARASLVMSPARRLELDRAVAVLTGVDLDGPVALRADALRLALRPAGPTRYEAVAEAEAVFPDPAAMDALDPGRAWPRRLAVLRLEAELAFDRPLDLDAAGGGPLPRAEPVLTGARAAWEGVDLRLDGRVALGATGAPAGEAVLSVEGWPALLAALDRAGMLTPEARGWIEAAAPGLARPGAPEAIDIPLRIVAGQVRLGPMVLFDLPLR